MRTYSHQNMETCSASVFVLSVCCSASYVSYNPKTRFGRIVRIVTNRQAPLVDRTHGPSLAHRFELVTVAPCCQPKLADADKQRIEASMASQTPVKPDLDLRRQTTLPQLNSIAYQGKKQALLTATNPTAFFLSLKPQSTRQKPSKPGTIKQH